jgi:histidine triad (HIT) family protein
LRSTGLRVPGVDYTGDDIYCDEILSGRLPVERVAETERVLAFHHSRPFWQTHIVVIPKAHVSSLVGDDLSDDLLAELLAVVRSIARTVTEEVGEAGVTTYLGRLQHAKHLHWHVIAGDQLRPTPERLEA